MCVCGDYWSKGKWRIWSSICQDIRLQKGEDGAREGGEEEKEEKKLTEQMKESDRNSWAETERSRRSRGIDGEIKIKSE